MNPHLLALARRRTYQLFGRLYLEGLTADLLPQLDAVPQLAEMAGNFDPDQAAAGHYQLTAVSVFPYQSIFLDPSGLLGGTVTEQIAALYSENGYETQTEADHIGHELLFLSHLCALETDAYVQGRPEIAALWRSRQHAFLSTQLLTWLPPLVLAIEEAGDTFYERLAGLTVELAADHLEFAQTKELPRFLPDPPAFASEESRLKDIAEYLVTPPHSGLFLSRDAVSALARRHQMPRGFGDRAQMLTNLLRTAGQYDAATAVFDDLAALCRHWQASYTAQQDNFPELAPWSRQWQERAAQTAELLADVTAEIESSTA